MQLSSEHLDTLRDVRTALKDASGPMVSYAHLQLNQLIATLELEREESLRKLAACRARYEDAVTALDAERQAGGVDAVSRES